MKVIVLDIGGTFIKAAIMNEKAEILEQWKVPSPRTNLDDFFGALDECINPHKEGAEGIAISMPGRIDVKKGIAYTGGAFKFILNLPIVEIMEERYGLPVTVDNDGKCAANAENWVGALKDVSSGLVYVIGTGIGGGIIIENKVHRGINFAAGELSCCLLDKNLGMSGSNFMAVSVATPGLVGAYSKKAGLEQPVDGIEFFKRVNEGEELAQSVLREFAKLTACYFFDLQTILDIERIAIGGGISAQPVLLEYIQEEVNKIFDGNAWLPAQKPELCLCQYGNDANLIGAMKNFMELKA